MGSDLSIYPESYSVVTVKRISNVIPKIICDKLTTPNWNFKLHVPRGMLPPSHPSGLLQ